MSGTQPDPYKYFRIEARELLDAIERGVASLESGAPAPDCVQKLLRLAHTLKGAARVVRQAGMADAAHAIEDVLAPHRDNVAGVDPASVARLVELAAELNGAAARLNAPASDPRPVQNEKSEREVLPPAPEAGDSALMMRADLAQMDALLDGLSNTHARVGGLRQAAELGERLSQIADMLTGSLPSPARRGGAEFNSEREAAGAVLLAQEMRETLRDLRQTLGSSSEHLEREMRQLREVAENLRLAPAGLLFPALERTARDAARLLGKRVEFDGRGGGVRLDAQVISRIQPALIQAVRNAVAHGIESPDERARRGKHATGTITLEVARRGGRAAFVCADDGGGVNFDSLRAVMRAKGQAADAAALGDDAILKRLMVGGLSSAGEVSAVSGRGIGLDVVRETVESLGGEASIQTEAGRGARIELLVPLSLASMEGLLFEAAGMKGVFPLDAVRRTVRLEEKSLSRTEHGVAADCGDCVIPYLEAADALGGGSGGQKTRGARAAVIVEHAGARAAIGVEKLVGLAMIVFRPLPALAAAHPVVAGVSLDADGVPRVVIEPSELIVLARQGAGAAQDAPAPPRAPVLVIDDSLTTRMLEKSILESAGYEVDLAQSAEEGLEKCRQRRYGWFLVDVEMPGMDGFAFVEKTRADPALKHTPAILISSLNGPNVQERSRAAGADAYIVKSEFDQVKLLDTMRRLQD